MANSIWLEKFTFKSRKCGLKRSSKQFEHPGGAGSQGEAVEAGGQEPAFAEVTRGSKGSPSLFPELRCVLPSYQHLRFPALISLYKRWYDVK